MLFFRIRNQLSMALGLLIGCALSAGAHVGSLVVPFAEVTDEMLSEIYLDGSVEEWSDLIGEPAMTLLDFEPERKEVGSLDPSDIDFRIWLAWHDEPARLYVAFVAADDRYWNTHTYDVDWITSDDDNMMRTWEGGNDGIVLGVDGDHSGGPGLEGSFQFEELLESSGETQQYEVVSRTSGGPILDDPRSRHWSKVFSWMTLPPYAEATGSVAGEAPVIFSIELYITPFDHRGEELTSPEGSVTSDLSPGQIIGFAIGAYDADLPAAQDEDPLANYVPEAQVDPHRRVFEDIYRFAADYFIDGLLLPANPVEPVENSAVESVSWGRIKASLW